MAAFDNTAPSAVPATVIGTPVVGDTTNGSAVVANISAPTIALLTVGMGVRGAGIPLGATISVVGVSSVTLSANATATAVGAALKAHKNPSAVAAAAGFNNTAPSAIPAV